MEEIDGERGAVAAAVVEVVMEKSAATREAEVEATAENATVAVVGEATVAATRGVAAPSAIVTVNRYANRRTVDPLRKKIYDTNEKSFLFRSYRQKLLE